MAEELTEQDRLRDQIVLLDHLIPLVRQRKDEEQAKLDRLQRTRDHAADRLWMLDYTVRSNQ
jgi:hypothetical protein